MTATVIGGVGTSHVPTVGVAIDKGQTDEPYWAPYFEKIEPAREWIASHQPDVCVVIYNDHASAFSLEIIPTFAIGVGAVFPPADEGYGPRPVPPVMGHPELAWHMAESLVLDEFDMTIVAEMPVDHGLTVPLSVLFGEPEEWPCRVVPICVNVIQYPPPTAKRCYDLGRAIRRALDSYVAESGDNERALIIGTGGMSHQLQGERAGLINPDFDQGFMDQLVTDPTSAAELSHTELMREAGSEGVELVMWLAMRGALSEARETYRQYHVPTSNTGNGLIILEEELAP